MPPADAACLRIFLLWRIKWNMWLNIERCASSVNKIKIDKLNAQLQYYVVWCLPSSGVWTARPLLSLREGTSLLARATALFWSLEPSGEASRLEGPDFGGERCTGGLGSCPQRHDCWGPRSDETISEALERFSPTFKTRFKWPQGCWEILAKTIL